VHLAIGAHVIQFDIGVIIIARRSPSEIGRAEEMPDAAGLHFCPTDRLKVPRYQTGYDVAAPL
jgi:hypothetical protein